MVNELVKHETKWLAPQPLWRNGGVAGTGGANGSAWQPAILRFDNDLFMEETLSLLAYNPEQLSERVAKPETWEKPMMSPETPSKAEVLEPISEFSKKVRQQRNKGSFSAAGIDKNDNTTTGGIDGVSVDELPFKLYQPAHQRFYLVAASLICRQVGMPDRRVDAGKQEVAAFVIRRVSYTPAAEESRKEYAETDSGWSEYAYVATEDGFAWESISQSERSQVQNGEERLPLFALNFNERAGHPRRMFAGLIPVGKREAYLSSPAQDKNKTAGSDKDSRQEKAKSALQALFETQVTAPWKALVEQVKVTHDKVLSNDILPSTDKEKEASANQAKSIIKEAREKIQTASWYIMLDFAKFLEKYLSSVWEKINGKDPGRVLKDQEGALIEKLKEVVINESLKDDLIMDTKYRRSEIPSSLADALVRLNTKEIEADLEAVDLQYRRDGDPDARWPRLLFPLSDPGVKVDNSPPWNIEGKLDLAGPLDIYAGKKWDDIGLEIDKIDALGNVVQEALPQEMKSVPDIQVPQQPLNPGDGWFIIRCVFERPNCGPLEQAVISRPTEKFQMAAFFDPDAPARQVRIALPADISPAGLRRFKKNATLMMSDMLCNKIGEIRKLTFGDLVLSVLPWPFHKDLPEPGKTGPCPGASGMYCSLSIPIVTLAALILLIIIVALFDIFFHWIPWLFTCFPIPGMRAKKK